MAHDTKKSMLMSLPVRSVARLDHGNEDFCCNNYCFEENGKNVFMTTEYSIM